MLFVVTVESVGIALAWSISICRLLICVNLFLNIWLVRQGMV